MWDPFYCGRSIEPLDQMVGRLCARNMRSDPYRAEYGIIPDEAESRAASQAVHRSYMKNSGKLIGGRLDGMRLRMFTRK